MSESDDLYFWVVLLIKVIELIEELLTIQMQILDLFKFNVDFKSRDFW